MFKLFKKKKSTSDKGKGALLEDDKFSLYKLDVTHILVFGDNQATSEFIKQITGNKKECGEYMLPFITKHFTASKKEECLNFEYLFHTIPASESNKDNLTLTKDTAQTLRVGSDKAKVVIIVGDSGEALQNYFEQLVSAKVDLLKKKICFLRTPRQYGYQEIEQFQKLNIELTWNKILEQVIHGPNSVGAIEFTLTLDSGSNSSMPVGELIEISALSNSAPLTHSHEEKVTPDKGNSSRSISM